MRVDHEHFLACLLVPEQANECLIVSLEVAVPLILIADVVEVNWFLCNQLKLILLITNEYCIHFSSIEQLAFVSVLFELWFVNIMVIIHFLEADDIREAMPIVEHFLYYSV